jgi:hypothetical protein
MGHPVKYTFKAYSNRRTAGIDKTTDIDTAALVKAYDTVNREMLWKILKTLGVPESLR